MAQGNVATGQAKETDGDGRSGGNRRPRKPPRSATTAVQISHPPLFLEYSID
jgi:hypothetical protein